MLLIIAGGVVYGFLGYLWLGGVGTFTHAFLRGFLRGYRHSSRSERQRLPVSAPVHDGPVAATAQLRGSGRIYLVRMGPHDEPYSLDEFAAWLKSKYGVDVQVLPATPLPKTAWDESRKQYVAELLYEQLKREHSDLAADPSAYLIGFTDADMYSVNAYWEFSFTQRDHRRAAIISAARMQDSPAEPRTDNSAATLHLHQRLRRILLKDVAILYWKLPLNNDPTSLLHDPLDPDLPAEDIYASDLNPEQTEWGRSEGMPCIFLRYSAKDGITPLPGLLVRNCDAVEDTPGDESQETFKIYLRSGLLIDKHTDFYLPDSIPIQFERATRDGWKGPMGFGLSGSHNYDTYLGSEDDMATIDVIMGDSDRERLDRVPKAMPFLSWVKFVDEYHSGKYYELRWRSGPMEHFDLKRYDGQVESFLPCDNRVRCFQIGLRNAEGQELVFQRDEHRRLLRLTSPGKQWLSFTYGPANAISKIEDSRGRSVRYEYDARDRLVSVTYPSGEIYRYEYDDDQHLLTFSVAPNTDAEPRVILRNTYKHGKLATQTLSDGSMYTYDYEPPTEAYVERTFVNTPAGRIFEVDMCDGCSSIRERTPAKPTGRPAPAVAGPQRRK